MKAVFINDMIFLANTSLGDEIMSKKIKFLLLTAMCLILTSAVAFAATPKAPVDQVLRTHGTITEINNDMITVQDTEGKQAVTLIVRWDTEILNGKNGENVDLNRLHVGDELTAYYSPVMTRSLPPQSKAYALVMGNGEHDAIYMHVGEIEQTKNGVRILSSNNDVYVTIPKTVEDDADKLKKGDKILVWYDFMALSMPAQATAIKAEFLD